MEQQLTVFKGRTAVVQVHIGFDVSADTFKSEIRKEENRDSDLIATWNVEFLSDGTDGKLVLTLDNFITSAIETSKGYMDLKRLTGGEPLPVFDGALEVLFQETVTV